MDVVWLVSVCVALLVLLLYRLSLSKSETARLAVEKAKETKSVASQPSRCAYDTGRHLEYTEEDLEMFMNRLSKVLFSEEPKKQASKTEVHLQRRTSWETKPETISAARDYTTENVTAYSKETWQPTQHSFQERTSQPADVGKVAEEIDQALHDTMVSEHYMRRRPHQPVASRIKKDEWSDLSVHSQHGDV